MILSRTEDYFQNRLLEWLERSSQENRINQLKSPSIAIGTEIGLKRRDNQDRVVFLRANFGHFNKKAFIAAVLSDGMGGMVQGGVCADIALSVFLTSLIRSKEIDFNISLKKAAIQANNAVFQKYSGDGGATLSAVIIDETKEIYALNVGDSRIYQVMSDGRIEQVSIDDTIGGQLSLINNQLSFGTSDLNQLVQYIGMGDSITPHEVKLSKINKLKSIILTSDGVHNICKDTFNSVINNAQTPGETIERLLMISKWCGGNDNATALSLFITESLSISIGKEAMNLVELWSSLGNIEFWPIRESQKVLIEDKNLEINQGDKERIDKHQVKRKSSQRKKQPLKNKRYRSLNNKEMESKDNKNEPKLDITFPEED
jgi:PPM family protein phosphatase